MGLCETCVKGTYEDSLGSIACKACPSGYYCPAGSAAPIPATCDPGTFVVNSTKDFVKDDCSPCPAGTACAGGQSQPATCLPGTVAPLNGSKQCTKCAAGSFQAREGQRKCVPCSKGYVCIEGSATGVPCPGGTYANTTGLSSRDQCVPVSANTWAPLGSALPEQCPPSGFYCPGAAADALYGGSKPIIIPTGGSSKTESVPSVAKEVTLDLTCASYNATAVLETLAVQYGVQSSLITLSDPCAGTGSATRRARSLQTGGLKLTITIATSGTATDGTPVSTPVADLLTAVQSVNDAALGASLSAALGTAVTVTASSAPAQVTIVRTVSTVCPKGKWCTAGLVVDCPMGTYNSLTGQNFATACIRCPEYSTTRNSSSTSIADCICREGFISTIFADESRKCECAAGMGIVNQLFCSPCALGSFKPTAGNDKVRPALCEWLEPPAQRYFRSLLKYARSFAVYRLPRIGFTLHHASTWRHNKQRVCVPGRLVHESSQ